VLPFAQVQTNLFNGEAGSSELIIKLIIGLVIGLAMTIAFMYVPTRMRRYLIGAFTFISGLVFVAVYFWPKSIPARGGPNEIPNGFVEAGSFFLDDVVNTVGDFATILTGFLLGLGIYSLVRIHALRVIKRHRDAFFSSVLLISIVVIAILGFSDWYQQLDPARASLLADQANWGFSQRAKDILFDGLLQEMDAAFFSIIAFYILSAAYRAFRIRSIEATILLATALIVMLSLMGAVEFIWGQAVDGITGGDKANVLNNLKLTEIQSWIRENVQNASLRAVTFGIGVGALAMGLRLWLSLERGGVRS
jgi:hypothetical protein